MKSFSPSHWFDKWSNHFRSFHRRNAPVASILRPEPTSTATLSSILRSFVHVHCCSAHWFTVITTSHLFAYSHLLLFRPAVYHRPCFPIPEQYVTRTLSLSDPHFATALFPRTITRMILCRFVQSRSPVLPLLLKCYPLALFLCSRAMSFHFFVHLL